MTRRFRLRNVLRARQVQEDAARASVLRARAEIQAAMQRRDDQEEALSTPGPPSAENAQAYLAAIAARSAMAAQLSIANQDVRSAEEIVGVRMTELTEAAMRRRSVERMAERHAEAAARAEEENAQRDMDELAGRQHHGSEDRP